MLLTFLIDYDKMMTRLYSDLKVDDTINRPANCQPIDNNLCAILYDRLMMTTIMTIMTVMMTVMMMMADMMHSLECVWMTLLTVVCVRQRPKLSGLPSSDCVHNDRGGGIRRRIMIKIMVIYR